MVTSDDLPFINPTPSMLHPRYLLSIGASVEAENESGEKPADLIDPDCKELVKMFEVGAVWAAVALTRGYWEEKTKSLFSRKSQTCHTVKMKMMSNAEQRSCGWSWAETERLCSTLLFVFLFFSFFYFILCSSAFLFLVVSVHLFNALWHSSMSTSESMCLNSNYSIPCAVLASLSASENQIAVLYIPEYGENLCWIKCVFFHRVSLPWVSLPSPACAFPDHCHTFTITLTARTFWREGLCLWRFPRCWAEGGSAKWTSAL